MPKTTWKSWSLPSKFNLIGSLTASLGLLLAISLLFFQPTSSTDIESKIKELDSIQTALVTLNSYVKNQQKALTNISKEKLGLENERKKNKTALKIDKKKLDALLEYQLARQRSGRWLELIVSFLIGVLSSSIVTFVAIRLQNRKQPADL